MTFTLLLFAFITLSVLDGYTTYLNLFKVPAELPGREMNPVFGNIRKNFRGAMVIKGLVTVAVAFLLLVSRGTFMAEVLDLALSFVVINNSYIFIIKWKWRKKVTSPLAYLSKGLQKVRMHKKLADVLAFYLGVTIIFGISYLIVRVLRAYY